VNGAGAYADGVGRVSRDAPVDRCRRALSESASAEVVQFTVVGDPVGSGLVKSFPRPGGNVTGLSTQHADAAGKRIELLHEVICPCSKNELSATRDTPVPAATS
jgi:hypothetical protein